MPLLLFTSSSWLIPSINVSLTLSLDIVSISHLNQMFSHHGNPWPQSSSSPHGDVSHFLSLSFPPLPLSISSVVPLFLFSVLSPKYRGLSFTLFLHIFLSVWSCIPIPPSVTPLSPSCVTPSLSVCQKAIREWWKVGFTFSHVELPNISKLCAGIFGSLR